MAFRIEKLGYSTKPWRLVNGDGETICLRQQFNHPVYGETFIDEPLSWETKVAAINGVCDLLEKSLNKIVELRRELNDVRSEQNAG